MLLLLLPYSNQCLPMKDEYIFEILSADPLFSPKITLQPPIQKLFKLISNTMMDKENKMLMDCIT